MRLFDICKGPLLHIHQIFENAADVPATFIKYSNESVCTLIKFKEFKSCYLFQFHNSDTTWWSRTQNFDQVLPQIIIP